MYLNRQSGLFPFNMPWHYQIYIAKCLQSHGDDLVENLAKSVPKNSKSSLSVDVCGSKRLRLLSLIHVIIFSLFICFPVLTCLVYRLQHECNQDWSKQCQILGLQVARSVLSNQSSLEASWLTAETWAGMEHVFLSDPRLFHPEG